MEEFFKQLNAPVPPVKIEEPDGNEFQRALSITDAEEGAAMVMTGLEALGEEMEAAHRKEAETAQKLADFMQQDEMEVVKKKRGRRSSEDDEKRVESKPPLTTFGHSSRPRRSVNYASIERGDEAQAQSLVTDFGTGKKRTKRTRDELDENYQEESAAGGAGKKKTKRRTTPWLPAGVPLAPLAANLLEADFRRAETEFADNTPHADDERPAPEQRAIMMMIDSLLAIKRSSGGFRRFIAWLTDLQIFKLKEIVERRYNVPKDTDDKNILRVIRHVYNSMPTNFRRDWEYAARMDIFESRHFVQGLSMPMSEIPVQSEEERDQKRIVGGSGVRVNCCELNPLLGDMRQTAEHYMLHHDVVHFFGCDFCYRIYSSRFELSKHECQAFCSMLLDLTVKGQRLEFEAAYLYLCCSQCGLWLPVKAASPSGNKGWHYFATGLKNHSCKTLSPVIIYLRSAIPEEGKTTRFTFNFMISTDVGFPTGCSECEIDEFATLTEAEEHFKMSDKHESFQCTKCSLAFGTEYLFRHHQQTHITQSAQFSNYLLYSATYQPPPNSGRRPHIGFLSEIPTVGGLVGPEIDAMQAIETLEEEYVRPNENTLRKKMLRWKHVVAEKKESRHSSESDASFSTKPSEDSSSSGSSSGSDSSSDDVTSNRKKRPKVTSSAAIKKEKEFRGDLGYEHVDRDELFGRDQQEQDAIDLLETVTDRKLFAGGERLLHSEEVIALLVQDGVEEAKMSSNACALAEEVAALTMKTVSLPAYNCIDPLKDSLLVNKVFNFCAKCQSVFSTEPSEHCNTCQVDEDSLIELSHAAAGPHAGIKCVIADCKLHICSVTALRTHCQAIHNISVSVESNTIDTNDAIAVARYDRSIMTLAKHFNELQIDDRSALARLTDIDCYMPLMGALERKQQYARPAQNPLRPAQTHAVIVSKTSNVKPYRIPRTSRWYSCQWCDKEYENLDSFVEHLSKMHVFTCLNCGHAFANLSTKRMHACSRQFPDIRDKPSMVVRGTCATCGERQPVDTLFMHSLRRHFSTIEYIQATGEILPRPIEPRCELLSMARASGGHDMVNNRGGENRTDYRIKLIRPGGPPIEGVPIDQLNPTIAPTESFTLCPPDYNHIDPRLMCYLCELTFDNIGELTSHLDEHPERFANCPFCPFVVESHFGLQKHLLKSHFSKNQQRMVCDHCNEPQSRFMCSHILYRCKRLPVCTICGQRSHDSVTNLQHMQRAHKLLLRRFQCGYCPTSFMSVGEFYEHKCPGFQTRVFSCVCAKNKYFPSINAFCDHFDSTHIAGQKCLMCRVDAPSQEILARHRMTHMTSDSVRNTQKRIYILVRWLYPKPESGYMRWVGGGTPPPSHMNIKRNQTAVLMGFENSAVPSFELPSRVAAASRVATTLFDVLEGPNAPSRRISDGAGTSKPPPPKKAAVVTDVICLSDDDDDDVGIGATHDDSDDILFEGTIEKGGHQNGESQVARQVRVEQTDKGYGGSQQPGYVDDDVEVAEAPEEVSAAEPVVKEINDENGDDELAVVAEVENASGTLPSNISAGREKKFKCSQCSMSYYTNQSLQAHLVGHRQDAGGQTCSEEYGLPYDTSAWLCRNCCIAFENFKQYEKHMAIHGDTSHSCVQCSGIAFNQATIVNHMKSHESRNVWYGCGTCLCKFPTDLALMDHLNKTHGIDLFYFCKVCGFGSTDPNALFNHIDKHAMNTYTISQRFGACPAQLLHYEPRDEMEFKVNLLKKTIKLRNPSDCAHRSLLLSNETVVACKTCHCTQPWFNFLAFNNYSDETGFPNFRIMETRSGFPLISHLSYGNQTLMARFAHSTRINRGPGNTVAGPVRPNQSVGSVLRRPPVPNVSTTPNGARVIRPQSPRQMVVTNRNTIVVPSTAIRRVTVNTTRSPPKTQLHALLPVIGRCHTCHVTISTEYDRLMHTMHASEDSWFCRMCGQSQKSEIELFVHYIREHLTPAYRRLPGFKPNVFQLHCPIDRCTSTNQFMSTKAFEKHVNQAHTELLPYQSSCCDARFRTQDLREKHEQRHNEYLETNGTDSSCCTLCGTLDMWSLPKDTETQCLQSHIIRHGLDYRSACRSCLKQFPADSNGSQITDHILKAHATTGAHGITCQICGEMSSNPTEFADHCKRSHVFNVLLKSMHSQRGELVVTTGSEYLNFVGLGDQQTMPTLAPMRSEPATQNVISDGGNAALLTIAAAIGETEVHTID